MNRLSNQFSIKQPIDYTLCDKTFVNFNNDHSTIGELTVDPSKIRICFYGIIFGIAVGDFSWHVFDNYVDFLINIGYFEFYWREH